MSGLRSIRELLKEESVLDALKDILDVCSICGAPEPCSRRACLEALQAQADYYEGTLESSDWGKR